MNPNPVPIGGSNPPKPALSGGGGGSTFDPMEARVARLEQAVESLSRILEAQAGGEVTRAGPGWCNRGVAHAPPRARVKTRGPAQPRAAAPHIGGRFGDGGSLTADQRSSSS